MQRITSHLLETYPFSRYATPQIIQRGRAWEVTMWRLGIVCQRAGGTNPRRLHPVFFAVKSPHASPRPLVRQNIVHLSRLLQSA